MEIVDLSMKNIKSQESITDNASRKYSPKSYLVTCVCSFVGVHLQSPEQQQQHKDMRKELSTIYFSKNAKSISDVFINMVYCAYNHGSFYRVKINKPIEGKKEIYLVNDIDTGRKLHMPLDDLCKLTEALRNKPELSVFRLLKNISVPARYKNKKKSRQKIFSYVSSVLLGKHILLEDISNTHIMIYYKNEYLNYKIDIGLQRLFNELTESDRNFAASPLNEFYCEMDDEPNCISDSEIQSIRGNATSLMSNIFYLVTIIEKVFEKRNIIFKMTRAGSVISNISKYILKNSFFHADIDDQLTKAKEIQKMHICQNSWSDDVKIRQLLTDFYNKQYFMNVREIEVSLQKHYGDLAYVCTEEEMKAAKQERNKLPTLYFNKSFSIFLKDFQSYKKKYRSSQNKTNGLLKSFVGGQTELIKWLTNLLQRNPFYGVEGITKEFSFDYIEKLKYQLIDEDHLSGKQSWLSLFVLLMKGEIQLRLNKISTLLRISRGIHKKYKYKNNFQRQSSNKASVSLLLYTSPPKALVPHMKCWFICDIYKELVAYHQKGIVYKYLNPSNVIITNKEKATLRDLNNVVRGEPFPTWQFIAPECDLSANLEADSYSLGQFILWLACIELNDNFLHEIRRIKQSCPIMNMISSDDSRDRPSLLAIEKSFVTIFANTFGITNYEKYNRLRNYNKEVNSLRKVTKPLRFISRVDLHNISEIS